MTAAMVAEDGSEARSWLLHRAADIAMQLDLTSYEELDEVMTGYLYSWTFSIAVMRDILDIIDSRTTVLLGGMEAPLL